MREKPETKGTCLRLAGKLRRSPNPGATGAPGKNLRAGSQDRDTKAQWQLQTSGQDLWHQRQPGCPDITGFLPYSSSAFINHFPLL